MMKLVHKFRTAIYLAGMIACICGSVAKCQSSGDDCNEFMIAMWPPDLVPHPPHFPTPPPPDPLA